MTERPQGPSPRPEPPALSELEQRKPELCKPGETFEGCEPAQAQVLNTLLGDESPTG